MKHNTARKTALFLLIISTLFTAFFIVSAILAFPITKAIPPIIVSIDLGGIWVLIDYHYLSCYKYLCSPESNDIQTKKKLQSRNAMIATIMAGITFCSLFPLLYFLAIYRVNPGWVAYRFDISAAISSLYAICTLRINKAI